MYFRWYEIGDIKPILRQHKDMAGILGAVFVSVVVVVSLYSIITQYTHFSYNNEAEFNDIFEYLLK